MDDVTLLLSVIILFFLHDISVLFSNPLLVNKIGQASFHLTYSTIITHDFNSSARNMSQEIRETTKGSCSFAYAKGPVLSLPKE